MADYDIHIKGGTIVDGTRVPRYQGDVWIKDGKIAKIGGRVEGTADRVIDADGLIVAPGFVDLHTHFDAQIRWDPWCSISSWHGVTSVVLGNCGFGFAPVKPDFVERSMLTMSRTEAIPMAAMQEGMNFDWETIPEYLDSLDRSPKGVNCIQYMPTASLMIYVMGLEAAKTRARTDAERKEMQRLLHEGMDVGLCGFSIQRLGPDSVQADFDGSPMVTDTMVDEDILALGEVLAERDEGFIQITQSTGDIKADLAFIEKLAEVAQRPILHNVITAARKDPEVHRRSLRWLDRVREKGLPIYGQTATVRSGFAFTLEHWNLYDASPAWRAVTVGTKEEKMAMMGDPDRRADLIDEFEEADRKLQVIQAGVGGSVQGLVIQGVNRQENLQKYVGKSVGEIAEAEGKHPIEAMLDISIEGDLNVEFLGPDRGSNAQFMAEMTTESPYTVPGVSDGGAHTKFFTGGAWSTDYLRWLVRDEGLITLEEAHYRMSALTAHAAGFKDRGVLREGAAADIVVYDMEELDIEPNWVGEVVHDLPAGEWRRVQRAKGYQNILVNGVETFENGECTGATPASCFATVEADTSAKPLTGQLVGPAAGPAPEGVGSAAGPRSATVASWNEEMSMDSDQRRHIIQVLHDHPAMLVLAVTGGGMAAVTDLLLVPGASRTVLEVTVPYAASALAELTGGEGGSSVAAETSEAMARACHQRAVGLAGGDQPGPLWGVGVTAALTTDRTRRGKDRAWISLNDGNETFIEKVEPAPGDRVTQDRVVADAVLAVLYRHIVGSKPPHSPSGR